MIVFTHGVIEVGHRRLPLVFAALFPVFFDSYYASSGDSENEQRVSVFDPTAILAGSHIEGLMKQSFNIPVFPQQLQHLRHSLLNHFVTTHVIKNLFCAMVFLFSGKIVNFSGYLNNRSRPHTANGFWLCRDPTNTSFFMSRTVYLLTFGGSERLLWYVQQARFHRGKNRRWLRRFQIQALLWFRWC